MLFIISFSSSKTMTRSEKTNGTMKVSFTFFPFTLLARREKISFSATLFHFTMLYAVFKLGSGWWKMATSKSTKNETLSQFDFVRIFFFQFLTSYKSISIGIGIDIYHSIAIFRIPHFRLYYFVSFISKSNVLIYIVAVHDGWMDGRTGDVCIGFTAFQRIVKDLRHGMDVVSLILVHF